MVHLRFPSALASLVSRITIPMEMRHVLVAYQDTIALMELFILEKCVLLQHTLKVQHLSALPVHLENHLPLKQRAAPHAEWVHIRQAGARHVTVAATEHIPQRLPPAFALSVVQALIRITLKVPCV